MATGMITSVNLWVLAIVLPSTREHLLFPQSEEVFPWEAGTEDMWKGSAVTETSSIESFSTADSGIETDAPKADIEMVDEYPVVHSIRTHVIKFGSICPTDTHIVLMIPGTPGAVEFTREFMETVHKKTGLPVWGLSYAGQSVVPSSVPWTKPDPHVFTLKGQIDHKLEFFNEFIPSRLKIILIGHSFGCYAILQMLHQLNMDRVAKCILLFPAIERMLDTERGQLVLSYMQSHTRSLALGAARVLSWIPDGWKGSIFDLVVRMHYKEVDVSMGFKKAVLEMIDPWCLNNVGKLVEEELQQVRELDIEHVRKHQDDLIFYYGATDWWAPVEYYEDLVEKLPGKTDIFMCQNGFRHCFVADSSVPMGKIVSEWITRIVEGTYV